MIVAAGTLYGPKMMGTKAMGQYAGVHAFLALATWIVLFFFLLLGAIYFWKQIQNMDKKKR
jgi:preprotein translocase subunit SecG